MDFGLSQGGRRVKAGSLRGMPRDRSNARRLCRLAKATQYSGRKTRKSFKVSWGHHTGAGCVPMTDIGVQYERCGDVYCRAAFQGNNLVYVSQ